jgi:hypothetical protein
MGLRFSGAVAAVLACGTVCVRPAEPAATNAPENQVLLNDNFDKVVAIPTNAVPPKLLPPRGISITNQIPSPIRGPLIPGPVQEREQNQRAGRDRLQFFPPFSPPLASCLATVDQFGNTALINSTVGRCRLTCQARTSSGNSMTIGTPWPVPRRGPPRPAMRRGPASVSTTGPPPGNSATCRKASSVLVLAFIASSLRRPRRRRPRAGARF